MQMCAPSITAGLLSCRHIHRSAAHPPGAHPEAVWVSERASEGGVGACCCCCSCCRSMTFFTPCRLGTTLCCYVYLLFSSFWQTRPLESTRRFLCPHANPGGRPLAYWSFVFFFSARAVRDLMGKHLQEVKGPVLCLLLKVDQFGSRPSLSIFWDPSTWTKSSFLLHVKMIALPL